PRLTGQFNYIKLHGSFDWRDPAGKTLLVAGGGKLESILESPLLNWYRDVFCTVCSAGNVRLFISGYGFGDEHINEVIGSAVKQAALGVFIHNTLPSREMQSRLASLPHGPDIWSGLIGYSSRSMFDIFPGTQEKTQELESIEESFFS
ncbi:MAG: SIR2 family protein, partial [Blastocatellia bacterium]